MKRVFLFLVLLCWLCISANPPASWAKSANPPAQTEISFLVVGDWPYRKAQIPTAQALINQMNQTPTDFIIHVGDIAHPGDPAPDKLTCSGVTFESVRQLFHRWQHPWIYTPGDNEWTDCARDPDEPFAPQERLAKLREMFLPPLQSYPFAIQAQIAPTVENRRWMLGPSNHPVVFATFHMVGSHNNLTYEHAADVAEFATRDAANRVWLEETFAQAQKHHAPAVVLFFHADPHFAGTYDEQLGFRTFVTALAQAAIAYGKPVLIVHGDSHHFRVDTPLVDGKTWPEAPNVYRLIGHGDPTIAATQVTIHMSEAAEPEATFTITGLDSPIRVVAP